MPELMESGSDDGAQHELRRNFAEAMAQLASGIVLVTTWLDEMAWGLTISACCSISADPPLMLISLGARTQSAAAIHEGGSFGVNILGERSLPVAWKGSARGMPKDVDQFCWPKDGEQAAGFRAPVVESAAAHLECQLDQHLDVADHRLFIGRVTRVARPSAGVARPLVYHRRNYRSLVDIGSDRYPHDQW